MSSSLIELVRSDAKISEIAAHLDALSQSSRLEQMYALTSGDQARLYEKSGDSERLDLDYFVPAATADRTEVVHYGKNSQPAFRMFQKRWCRPAGRTGELYGYNETPVRHLIGPGYFVAHETADAGADHRGAIVVDYFMVPDSEVVPGWPPVKPNSQGLQTFVYNNTRDYMRRVSQHVSIGVAYRKESKVMGYFVLCRDERA